MQRLHPLHSSTTGSSMLVVVGAIVLIAIIAVAIIIGGHHSKPAVASNPNACVSKNFSSGATGQCVSDIQNMANNQAYGIDGQLYIPVTGTYDAATVTTVKTFQKNFNLPQTGSISSSDWKQLCNAEEPSPAFTKAAKDAGCN